MENIRPECGFCPDADHCHIDNKEASARLGRCLGSYTVSAEERSGGQIIGAIKTADGGAVISWDGYRVTFRGRNQSEGHRFTLRDFLSSLGVTDDDLARVIRERMEM